MAINGSQYSNSIDFSNHTSNKKGVNFNSIFTFKIAIILESDGNLILKNREVNYTLFELFSLAETIVDRLNAITLIAKAQILREAHKDEKFKDIQITSSVKFNNFTDEDIKYNVVLSKVELLIKVVNFKDTIINSMRSNISKELLYLYTDRIYRLLFNLEGKLSRAYSDSECKYISQKGVNDVRSYFTSK